MALMTALLGSVHSKDLCLLLGGVLGWRGGRAGLGEGPGLPDRLAKASRLPSPGQPWPRPGWGGGQCWAPSRPPRAGGWAVVSLLPRSQLRPLWLQNGGGLWRPFCGALGRQRHREEGGWGPAGSRAGRRRRHVRSGNSRLACVEAQREAGRPFWNLPPAQAPSCPGLAEASPTPPQGSGWSWGIRRLLGTGVLPPYSRGGVSA